MQRFCFWTPTIVPTACSGGGHNANGTQRGIATNLSHPCDSLGGFHHVHLEGAQWHTGRTQDSRSRQTAGSSLTLDRPLGFGVLACLLGELW